MIKQKNLYMANFNCTFGDDNKPLLSYFEEIVEPAFFENYVKQTSRNKYFFNNVKLVEYKPNKFAISGLIVKKTILEVKSLIDENTGNIIKKDERIPSDPFSYFIIFLENHRMVLVKNQSGSPDLTNFESLAKHTLKQASVDYCGSEKKYIKANLNVGSLPCSSKINEELEKMTVISEMILKLYPLNGDIDNAYGGLRRELSKLGCVEGISVSKSPKNRDAVKETLEQGRGLFRATVKGKGENNEKITITEGTVAAVIPVNINEDKDEDENIAEIFNLIENRAELQELSEENKNTYVRVLGKIKESFARRRRH